MLQESAESWLARAPHYTLVPLAPCASLVLGSVRFLRVRFPVPRFRPFAAGSHGTVTV